MTKDKVVSQGVGRRISAPSFGMKSPGMSIGDSAPSIALRGDSHSTIGECIAVDPVEELSTPTSNAFDDLRTVLEATSVYITTLERRLNPVSAQRDCGANKTESYPSRGSSPIVQHIESVFTYVQSLNGQLSSIIDNLEI